MRNIIMALLCFVATIVSLAAAAFESYWLLAMAGLFLTAAASLLFDKNRT